MVEELLQAGIEALKSGNRRRARRLLGQVVNDDPDNVLAWWYLAAALDDAEQRVHCLRQVLRLRPDHEEARRMLTVLERHVAQITPPHGIPHPTLETREDTRGDLVAIPDTAEGTAPDAGTPAERAPTGDVTVMAAATIVALLAIAVTVILVWTGLASDVLGIHGPDLGPTQRVLTFGVPACTTVSDGSTTLVFINNTGMTVEILRGPQGAEEPVLTLTAGHQGTVETQPGEQVRYAISTQAEGVVGSGAQFEVPRGNMCRVPIQ